MLWGVPAVVRRIRNRGKDEGSNHREFRVGKPVVAKTEGAVLGAAALDELEESVGWEDEGVREGVGGETSSSPPNMLHQFILAKLNTLQIRNIRRSGDRKSTRLNSSHGT